MNDKERLKGCLIYGAIGDSIGGKYEGSESNQEIDINFNWSISDDTQLTLATCEAIYDSTIIHPDKVAKRFVDWFNNHKLSGLGSSTLKALRELQLGGHWALVGRSGEYAAGNGAAMRIAPLAFKKSVDLQIIKDICSITHKNDEAYVGALAVYYSIINSKNGVWSGDNDLISMIVDYLPDTKVRDRLIELDKLTELSIIEIGNKYKPTGYVVDSIPFSIYAAQKISKLGVKKIFNDIIRSGGDTDTNCSITGQIVGSLIGEKDIPKDWLIKFNDLREKDLINKLVDNWKD